MIARLDLIEGDGTHATPVDYKRGAPKDTEQGPEAWPADRAQLCVQAIVLREHGFPWMWRTEALATLAAGP